MNNYNWKIEDLIAYDKRIVEIGTKMGLNCFPVEFELCDSHDMIGYQSYIGMPSAYPHWSRGKSFERTETLYNHGVQGLAYEMVINTNPSLAYLMIDNPLSIQILVMAHVYGHVDFFKNNKTFSHTKPHLVLDMFRRHAERVRAYNLDPSIGYTRVDRILDAAHALRFQCPRYLEEIFWSEKDERNKITREIKSESFQKSIWGYTEQTPTEQVLNKYPIKQEEDILKFIMQHADLREWEQDVIQIVCEERNYFLPQSLTQVVNEGWACFWHWHILNRLDLPQELQLEWMKSHAGVVRMHRGGLNPYHIGFTMMRKLSGWKPGMTHEYDIDPIVWEARNLDTSESFLRRFLDMDMAEELELFSHTESNMNGQRIVDELPDSEDSFKKIKKTLLQNIGLNSVPSIVVDNLSKNKELELVHIFDGRELQLEYARNTLQHIYNLWENDVVLITQANNREKRLKYTKDGFSVV